MELQSTKRGRSSGSREMTGTSSRSEAVTGVGAQLPGLDLFELARESLVVLDQHENVVFWSRGAERMYGWTQAEVAGKSPFEFLKTELPRPFAQIENILRSEPYWDGELKQTTKQGERVTVASRWALWRDGAGQHCGRFQLDNDITKRKQVENELRILSGRLLTLRDEERRRLARDLHDSVGQLLAGASMNLAMLQRRIPGTESEEAKLVTELSKLLEQSVKEIRTLSYLLHPPLLDEVGLPSALEWYVSGFAGRSQIKVDLEIPENLGRFRREAELAVFRIVQETLTNIHRHSGSPSAKIALSRSRQQVRLRVEDRGKGISPSAIANNGSKPGAPSALGVGISGIRERVRQLGGQMQVRTGQWGTSVEVILPLEEVPPLMHEARSGS